MKKYINKLVVLVFILGIFSCDSLDRFPLDNPSSETFFSNQQEMEVAVNRLYSPGFFDIDNEKWGDNEWNRSGNGNSFLHGTNTSETGAFKSAWDNSYAAINRANIIIEKIDDPTDYQAGVKERIEGEAKFTRAYNYALLAIRYKNVPLIKNSLALEDYYQAEQSTQNEVLDFVFADLDDAINLLPWSYSGIKRITKGAALTLKARIALYVGRFQEAAEAAKQVMDSQEYALYPSYRDLFLEPGQTSSEIIFSLPRSATFGDTYNIQYTISRMAGGFASNIPTLSMVDSYECTDGLTIDESPLYDINNPFENRDPRLRASIVVPGDEWLGFVFDSRFSAKKTTRLSDGSQVKNDDNIKVKSSASPIGLVERKGIPDVSPIDFKNQDLDIILMRYAEVLLTYAEAKIELNDIDQSVLDAINSVRARAYGVDLGDTANYPAITTTNQSELRRYLRRERRVEFFLEGFRYRDLLRWGIAEKAFNKTWYGMSNTETPGFPIYGLPTFDENDLPDYSSFSSNLRSLDVTSFNPDRDYLWAIPSDERILLPQLNQNPGY